MKFLSAELFERNLSVGKFHRRWYWYEVRQGVRDEPWSVVIACVEENTSSAVRSHRSFIRSFISPIKLLTPLVASPLSKYYIYRLRQKRIPKHTIIIAPWIAIHYIYIYIYISTGKCAPGITLCRYWWTELQQPPELRRKTKRAQDQDSPTQQVNWFDLQFYFLGIKVGGQYIQYLFKRLRGNSKEFILWSVSRLCHSNSRVTLQCTQEDFTWQASAISSFSREDDVINKVAKCIYIPLRLLKWLKTSVKFWKYPLLLMSDLEAHS